MIKRLAQDSRLMTYPIARPELWDFYKAATGAYWKCEEISLGKDYQDIKNLTIPEYNFVKYILMFFASADGIVNINLAKRFSREVDILEVSYFYDFQAMMENMHAEMYSILVATLLPEGGEDGSGEAVGKMTKWMLACADSVEPFGERLLRMACSEGLFFTGFFCAIYWLQSRGIMPGLAHSNELIARDEALHTMFALKLFTMLEPRPGVDRVRAIFGEAVDIACGFVDEALPEGMAEMNAELMREYIQSQADNMLALIGVAPMYGVRHRFHFMEQINLLNRTNTFDRRVSEYAGPMAADKCNFEVNMDF